MTPTNHARWCITQCPCFAAEQTVYWFLSGKRDWNPWYALKFKRSWK